MCIITINQAIKNRVTQHCEWWIHMVYNIQNTYEIHNGPMCYQTRNIRKHFQFHSHSLNVHRCCLPFDIDKIWLYSREGESEVPYVYAVPLSENKDVKIIIKILFFFVFVLLLALVPLSLACTVWTQSSLVKLVKRFE